LKRPVQGRAVEEPGWVRVTQRHSRFRAQFARIGDRFPLRGLKGGEFGVQCAMMRIQAEAVMAGLVLGAVVNRLNSDMDAAWLG